MFTLYEDPIAAITDDADLYDSIMGQGSFSQLQEFLFKKVEEAVIANPQPVTQSAKNKITPGMGAEQCYDMMFGEGKHKERMNDHFQQFMESL